MDVFVINKQLLKCHRTRTSLQPRPMNREPPFIYIEIRYEEIGQFSCLGCCMSPMKGLDFTSEFPLLPLAFFLVYRTDGDAIIPLCKHFLAIFFVNFTISLILFVYASCAVLALFWRLYR